MQMDLCTDFWFCWHLTLVYTGVSCLNVFYLKHPFFRWLFEVCLKSFIGYKCDSVEKKIKNLVSFSTPTVLLYGIYICLWNSIEFILLYMVIYLLQKVLFKWLKSDFCAVIRCSFSIFKRRNCKIRTLKTSAESFVNMRHCVMLYSPFWILTIIPSLEIFKSRSQKPLLNMILYLVIHNMNKCLYIYLLYPMLCKYEK